MSSKKRPIADLPRGVTVYKDGDSWRARLAPSFTMGRPVKKRFDTIAEARAFVDEQKASRNQINAFQLSPSQLADAKSAFDILAGREGNILTAAAIFYNLHHRKPNETKPVDAAVEAFLLAKKRKGLKPRSLQAYKDTLGTFGRDHKGLTIAQLTKEDVVDWLDEEDWQRPTIRHHQVNLSVFFSWSISQKWIAASPLEGVELPEADDTPPGILTVGQLANLLAVANKKVEFQPLVPSLAIGAFAGLRTSEIAQLDWTEVSLDHSTIEVTAAKAKTRQRRIVTISENLKAWLIPFACKEGRIWTPNRRKLFPSLIGASSIAKWPKNALRHSFASYHLAQHGDAGKTALQLGHRDTHMLFSAYRELVKPSQAAIYWDISPENVDDVINHDGKNAV